MPYLKKDRKHNEKLAALIEGKRAVLELNYSELADFAGVSVNTLREKMKDPDKMTLGMLTGICRKLHIPVDDVRQALEI